MVLTKIETYYSKNYTSTLDSSLVIACKTLKHVGQQLREETSDVLNAAV